MIPVILSGGSGSRLWPLSRKDYPKQFWSLYGDDTMLQATAKRVARPGFAPPILICNEQQRFFVQEQMEQIDTQLNDIIVEPVGRNTAPAIAMAALHILAQGGDEPMLVLPADHVITDEDAFHQAIQQALTAANSGHLVTFGITPDKPETGYGYIQSGNDLADGAGKLVKRFVEKPELATAKAYLAEGDYFWNSGIFLFRASHFINELKLHAPDILASCEQALAAAKYSQGALQLEMDSFAACRDESIDYAVMEGTEKAAIVPMSCGWSDVGSWSSLWEVNDKDASGNVLRGDIHQWDSVNCYVRSEDRVVSLIGLKDLVVVDTKDALLIADKSQVQDVKKAVNKLKGEARPEVSNHREVYRSWGSHDALDKGDRFQVRRVKLKPGQQLSLQMHHHRAEHWIVVKGTAVVECGDKKLMLSENESTYIPLGSPHRLSNPGKIPLELVEVHTGAYLGEDDVTRLETNEVALLPVLATAGEGL